MLRRVAYETMSMHERKARHLAAAAYLSREWDSEDELAAVLAAHHLDAYRAGARDPDAPELKIQARDSLAKAAERAISLAAASEAARYFVQAADLADEPGERAQFLASAGRAAMQAGHAREAYAAFEQAIALLNEVGDRGGAARVEARAADLLRFEGRIDEALTLMRSAYDALVGGEHDAELALVAAQLGRLAYFAGVPEDAHEPVELALDLAEALRLPDALADALNTKGMLLYRRPHESEALLQESLKIALEHDLHGAVLRARFNLSGLAIEHDRLHSAKGYLEDSLALARRRGDRTVEANDAGQLAEVLAELGDWQAALELLVDVPAQSQFAASNSLNAQLPIAVARGELDEARAMFVQLENLRSSSDRQDLASYRLCEAILRRGEGEPRDAVEAAEAARELWAGLTQFHYAIQALVQLVEALLECDDLEQADRLLAEAEAMPAIQRRPLLEAQQARLRAKLGSRQGSPTAGEGYADAVARFRELEMPFWLAVSLLEQGEWLREIGEQAAAEPGLAEARAIFERLEARPWLDRFTQLEESQPSPADSLAGSS
jgi:hypothetical protein